MKAIYVKTLYSLLLSLILLEDDINNITIFYNYNTNSNYKEIFKKFQKSIEIPEIKERNRLFFYLKSYLITNKFLRIIKNKKIEKIYIQDYSSLFGQFFLNNVTEAYIIEDGTANYNLELLRKNSEGIKKKIQ